MERVKIQRTIDKGIVLNNGSLVLIYDTGGCYTDAFIVTSFRDGKNKYHGQSTNQYCSLVNLDTGYIDFEERCSRRTTGDRLRSHLNNMNRKFPVGNIQIVSPDQYQINITVPAEV